MIRSSEDSRSAGWLLYDPVSGERCTFVSTEPARDQAALEDLESNDRAWRGGSLDAEVYLRSQSLRLHRDLREANLEVNHVCRYACRHCFQSLLPARPGPSGPGLAELEPAARRLLDAGAIEISITGGDIFLQPHLWDLLDFLHREAPRTTLRLLANGGSLDLEDGGHREHLRRLVGRRVILRADFFGHSAPLHDDFTRVAGSFRYLVRLFQFARELGLACLPNAALTRANFATRFELVNFLFNLTDGCFTVSSQTFPSDFRDGAELARIRLAPEDHAEILEERYFSPLAAEYHSFEPQCEGDCEFAVLSAEERGVWGCSFLKVGSGVVSAGAEPDASAIRVGVAAWREIARSLASWADCPTCPARSTCRKCPSFLSGSDISQSYCDFSRRARAHVDRRVREALQGGFAFLHPEDASRLGLTDCDPSSWAAP